MRKIHYLLYLLTLTFCLSGYAQEKNSWIATNSGIGDFSKGESFEIQQCIATSQGNLFAAVHGHSKGDNHDGIYQFQKETNSWKKIGPKLSKYGFNQFLTNGTRLFAIASGNNSTIHELDLSKQEWKELTTLPKLGIQLNRGIDALGDYLYIHCSIDKNDVEDFPNYNFLEHEAFIMKVNINDGSFELLRNKEKPLFIYSRGGNPKGPIALKNGKVYTYQTFEYRDQDGYGGIYE